MWDENIQEVLFRDLKVFNVLRTRLKSSVWARFSLLRTCPKHKMKEKDQTTLSPKTQSNDKHKKA